MRENKLKNIWNNGDVVFNGWLQIPNTWTAELMAHAGYDSITIDMQHGLHSMENAIQLLQAISITDTVPLARVNWNEPGSIMRLLDAGAYGIICPMVNTQEECEAFVGACRYSPQGYRSLGPTRATLYAGSDYADHANDTVLALAMIETKEALENVDAITRVPGLDGVYIGPGDLHLSLFGEAGSDSEKPEFLEALQTILDTCRKNGVMCGMHTSSVAYAQKMTEFGMQMVTVSSDSGILYRAASGIVSEFRGKTPDTPQDPKSAY